MVDQPDDIAGALSDEQAAQEMILEGCPNTGPFFWQRNEDANDEIDG